MSDAVAYVLAALALAFAGLFLGVLFASGLKIARELERRAGT